MKFAFVPKPWPQAVSDLEAAGHTHVGMDDEPDLVMFRGTPRHFPERLPGSVKVVQVCYAGVEELAQEGILAAHDVRWANAAGLFDDTVAESALALLLAVLHQHKAVEREWNQRELFASTNYLFDKATVAIIGAGGIGRTLIKFLEPFGVDVIAVNRSGTPVEGAARTVAMSDPASREVWSSADYFVLLAPLTEETRHMVDAEVLELMPSHAVVVNVGRGPLIDHDALADALRDGTIAGAGLDVTEPEPLPADHPLWDMPNCVITPHTANIPRYTQARIGALADENWRLYSSGETMRTEVDVDHGY
ncbi:D-isomer specific 2-hydroxyacid dehydrogenase family protein [Corynebacterium sp.]|uniref:D-isomer specific 2-hydroxyacid dehydrogenase family protein n=1 Tax=Corynebacterium sp. TaxID=1720 RepID=UPI002A90CB75|nr:D-isomer specific 2-hydroxyacid dehydrogenase family protein [Corynebacterium sp.]MDY5784869.1 D-isomer specific 2-hydroxyacid dehydrogenase family protein [Corynebacterium sp.]